MEATPGLVLSVRVGSKVEQGIGVEDTSKDSVAYIRG